MRDRTTGAGFALHCVGDVRLYRDTRDCTPKSRKGRALLAILAAEKRPLTRVRIIDLLWSDRQEEQARASLRTLLAELRTQFGDDFEKLLVVDRERVALAPLVRTDLTDPTLIRPAGELFEGLDHLDPELDDWLRTERERWSGLGAAVARTAPPVARRAPRLWILAVVLIAVLAAAAAYHFTRPAEPEQPVVAVLPLRDSTGAHALLAEGLAEDLRVHLSERDGLQVIGRQSSEVSAVAKAGAAGARRMLGATHLVEGSVLPGKPARISVRLVEASDGRVVWSHTAAARPDLATFGPNGLAKVIADQVTETVEQTGPSDVFAADPASYQKLFEARRLIARVDSVRAPEARRILLDVVQRNPRFAPALAALAEATFRSSNHPFYRGPLPLQAARKEAERHALEAVRLAPKFGLAYLALGQARLDTPGALAPLRKAVDLSPGSSRARYRLARALESAGDIAGALKHQRVALKLEPLDPNASVMLVSYLAWFDDRDEIREVLAQFLERSDNRADELRVGALVASMLGDYPEYLAQAIQEADITPANQQARRSVMWALMSLGEARLAVHYAQPGSVTDLILRGSVDSLVDRMRALGPDFWMMNYETIGAADLLVRSGRSKELVDSYFSAGKVLSEDLAGAIPLSVALRQQGFRDEERSLLKRHERWLTRASAGKPEIMRNYLRAEYWSLTGNHAGAIAALEQMNRHDWTFLSGSYRPMTEFVSFAHIRQLPRFQRLRDDFYDNLNRARRAASAKLQSLGKANEAAALARPARPV